ncbi:hypothetical protein ACA910_017314 [Epithemia clementina (nom. ined.)]
MSEDAATAAVPGEVVATDSTFRNVRGFPKETALAKHVLDLPELTKGHVLVDTIPRCLTEGKLIKYSIERGRGKFLKLTDTFSVLDHDGEPFLGGIHVVESANLLGKTRIVVKNKEEHPIILAVEETLKINKAYMIYGKTPLFPDDPQQEAESGTVFYPMFKVRDIDDTHLDFRSLLIWNGHNYQPYLHIVPAKSLPDTPGGQLVPPRKNDLLLVDRKDMDKIYALMAKKGHTEKRAGWDCVVAPGTDVGMCIILSVIMDDMVGWFA